MHFLTFSENYVSTMETKGGIQLHSNNSKHNYLLEKLWLKARNVKTRRSGPLKGSDECSKPASKMISICSNFSTYCAIFVHLLYNIVHERFCLYGIKNLMQHTIRKWQRWRERERTVKWRCVTKRLVVSCCC